MSVLSLTIGAVIGCLLAAQNKNTIKWENYGVSQHFIGEIIGTLAYMNK